MHLRLCPSQSVDPSNHRYANNAGGRGKRSGPAEGPQLGRGGRSRGQLPGVAAERCPAEREVCACPVRRGHDGDEVVVRRKRMGCDRAVSFCCLLASFRGSELREGAVPLLNRSRSEPKSISFGRRRSNTVTADGARTSVIGVDATRRVSVASPRRDPSCPRPRELRQVRPLAR